MRETNRMSKMDVEQNKFSSNIKNVSSIELRFIGGIQEKRGLHSC